MTQGSKIVEKIPVTDLPAAEYAQYVEPISTRSEANLDIQDFRKLQGGRGTDFAFGRRRS